MHLFIHLFSQHIHLFISLSICIPSSDCALFLIIFSDEANTIHLKPDLPVKEPVMVKDHDVPIFLWDQRAWSNHEWDITTQQV